MTQLNRDIHGSGRVLYRKITHKEVHDPTVAYGSVAMSQTRKVEVYSDLYEADITEWSPSGNRVRLNTQWFDVTEVLLVEVLASAPKPQTWNDAKLTAPLDDRLVLVRGWAHDDESQGFWYLTLRVIKDIWCVEDGCKWTGHPVRGWIEIPK